MFLEPGIDQVGQLQRPLGVACDGTNLRPSLRKQQVSWPRTPNICPVTSFASSALSHATRLATCTGSIFSASSQKGACSVTVDNLPRGPANGAIAFDNPVRAMSNAAIRISEISPP